MTPTESKIITLQKYDGSLDLVHSIERLIQKKYSNLFHSVIVHGSVATNEVIPYSDFDGLLIVKDAFANSNELKSFKKESLKLIYKFDPLQHHGWFQILESQLDNYPEYYLPYEILNHSKRIYPNDESLTLNLIIDFEALDYKRSLKQLIASINQQSKMDVNSMKLYDFKSYLSKIMLLPSMYYAAKYNKGVFKKESFDLVRQDFSESAWLCIETASDIRANWTYNLNGIQKFIMTRPYRPFRRLTKKVVSPNINTQFSNKIDDTFYKSLKDLINTINKDIFVA
ncbi:hypothetical protein [Psychroserpens sp.]|uniref:nucleotidyltransferase domain-containing protein n=1 Tax=Psychroserpens sp. TaxID=2020870 RepID=UPI00385B96B2